MRFGSIWISVVLIVSILSPIASHVIMPSHNHEKCIVSLDVCNTPGSFISANGDTPLFFESLFKPLSFEFAEYIESGSFSYTPALFLGQLERPPKS